MPNPSDESWMRRALELAARGRGAVEPNPMVGAVAVREGVIVGEGWHQQFGGPHAEVFALSGEARGATLYVTLEPCCHQGKTPPCTKAVIAAGISRVVAAMLDPFPKVAGGGFVELRAAGIAVENGVCEAEARELNAPYLTLLEKGRPWVIAKWAMTLDGRIATRTGDSKWISNEGSRRKVHELRGRVDAIVVGSGTALADDPALTARPPGPRVATRVVLDRRGRLPLTSQLVRTAREVPTLVVTECDGAAFREAGCEVLNADLSGLMGELGRRRCTNVLVEGGAGVLGAFFDAGLVDEVEAFVAPVVIGGESARSPVGGAGVEKIGEGRRLDARVEVVEGDVWVRGRLGA
jgi:diaminohydroxyphosphoribosylaminopyrimidine deaminase/5-amino-6-(5-phosphoribosylamino)uracil reductase